MKLFFLLLIVQCCLFKTFWQQGESTNSKLIKKIEKIDFSKYENKKTPGDFFKEEAIKYKNVIFHDKPPAALYKVSFTISDSLSLEFYFNKFKYTKGYDAARQWKANTILKEQIRRISVQYGDSCIKGCDFDPSPNIP